MTGLFGFDIKKIDINRTFQIKYTGVRKMETEKKKKKDDPGFEIIQEGTDSGTRTGNMHKDSCGY